MRSWAWRRGRAGFGDPERYTSGSVHSGVIPDLDLSVEELFAPFD